MSDKAKPDRSQSRYNRLEAQIAILTKRLALAEKDFANKARLVNLESKVNALSNIKEASNKTASSSVKYPGKVVDTFWCYFLLGSNKAYDTNTHIALDEVLKHVKTFQEKYWKDSVSVVVTPNNTVVFKNYNESCYRVEAINYPRFPKTEKEICEFMLTLMEYLMLNLDQQRISLVTPSKTVMIENTDLASRQVIVDPNAEQISLGA